jgi:hypothetical protein
VLNQLAVLDAEGVEWNASYRVPAAAGGPPNRDLQSSKSFFLASAS